MADVNIYSFPIQKKTKKIYTRGITRDGVPLFFIRFSRRSSFFLDYDQALSLCTALDEWLAEQEEQEEEQHE